MSTLQQKIKELETQSKEQLKVQKAKLMAKYRAEKKKEEIALEKLFLSKFKKIQKQINNNDILLGGLLRTLEFVKADDQVNINKLIDLSKTLAD